jgi:putative chitinase
MKTTRQEAKLGGGEEGALLCFAVVFGAIVFTPSSHNNNDRVWSRHGGQAKMFKDRLTRLIAVSSAGLCLCGDVPVSSSCFSLWQDTCLGWKPPAYIMPPAVAQDFQDLVREYPPLLQGKVLYRLAHFLGQCSYESCFFKQTTESMNYSSQRLLEIFPRYFSKKNALQYAGCPQKIANKAYANRMGNGDERSGDGYRFRGRGFLQLTGKNIYAQFSRWTPLRSLTRQKHLLPANFLRNPDAVAHHFSWISAVFYFETRQLWDLCDQGIDPVTIAKISYIINGGFHGLRRRIAWTHWWYQTLRGSCGDLDSVVR